MIGAALFAFESIIRKADIPLLGHFPSSTLLFRLVLMGSLLVVAKRGESLVSGMLNGLLASWRAEAPLRNLFFGLLGVAVMCHFFRLANFLLSIDDEYAASRTDPSVWLEQGRWTIYWLERLVMTQPTLPFFPDAIFCLCITLSYLMVLKSHAVRPNFLTYLLFPLFCAFPSLTVLGEFYANLPGLGLGFILCSGSVLLGQKLKMLPLSTINAAGWGAYGLMVAASMGCYQAFALVYIAFSLGVSLCSLTDDGLHEERHLLKAHIAIFVRFLACFALYNSIHQAHLYFFCSSETYIAHIMRLDLFWAHPFDVIKTILIDLFDMYGGAPRIYGTKVLGLLGVMSLGAFGLAEAICTRPSKIHKAIGFLLAMELLGAPFAFLITSGGHLPFRTFVALPYVVWFFGWFALRQRWALVQGAGIVCVLVCVFEIIYVNNLYAAEMAVAQQRDRSFASEIYQRLEATRPDFSLSKDYKVDIFGMMPHRSSLYPTDISSTTASSFFNWDNGNPLRMLGYMNLLGYGNIHAIAMEDRAALNEIYRAMPIWPQEGSVVWQGDMALVKLGDQPGIFHTQSE